VLELDATTTVVEEEVSDTIDSSSEPVVDEEVHPQNRGTLKLKSKKNILCLFINSPENGAHPNNFNIYLNFLKYRYKNTYN